jgi:hypothetical protein
MLKMPFKRVGVLLLLIGSISNLAKAQVATTPGSTPGSVTAKPSPFTDQLRKTVVFLRVTFIKEGKTWEILGTGFFMFYPDERLGKDRGFTYLVTNRHMAQPGAEEGHGYAVQQFYVRFNAKKQPSSAAEPVSVEVPLASGPGAPWAFPSDSSVDLAAIPVNPEQVFADYEAIPVALIATKEAIADRQITAGDQVLFAGYFYQFPGDKRIQPIIRQGVLAMIPDEQIDTTLQERGAVYLADIHAFHGNSGSPLFVNTGGIRGSGFSASSYMLLGVVSGYYPESETTFSTPAARVLTGEVRDNSGISAIVPGYEVKALLDIPALKQARESTVETF